MDGTYFEEKKENAKRTYDAQRSIRNPYFGEDITLNSDGFHHLRYSARRERNKDEQVLKFTLLPLGFRILKTATTVQEYRKLLTPTGSTPSRDGSVAMKLTEWWGFVAIFIEHDIKVRVIVRRVGDGNLHFWSVMPFSKLRRGDRPQKMHTEGLEDG
jgi:hypothetical protein